MNEQRQKKGKLQATIIILAILLGISSVTLGATLLYKHFISSEQPAVIVPDNIIMPNTEIVEIGKSSSEKENEKDNETNDASAINQLAETEETKDTNESKQTSEQNTDANVGSTTGKVATVLSLHNRNAGDNTPFHVGNMFPGDTATKYFCVRVSYQDSITVKYYADIRTGYEKLAEVMKCRIVLLNTGAILYDGLMRDMPTSLDHSLYSAEGTTSELYYEITTYLDTSVGNEYQNKSLIADFQWWVEEESHLIDAPQTGDESNIILWTGVSILSLFMLLLLIIKQRKEEQHEKR